MKTDTIPNEKILKFNMNDVGKQSAIFAIDEMKNNFANLEKIDHLYKKNIFLHESTHSLKKQMQEYFQQDINSFIKDSKFIASFAYNELFSCSNANNAGKKKNKKWISSSYTYFDAKLNTQVNLCVSSSIKNMNNSANQNIHKDGRNVMQTVLFTFSCIHNVAKILKSRINNEPFHLNIYCLLLDNRRCIPKIKGDTIGTSHINAGVSNYVNSFNSEIFVYRKEHLHKVIIHEIIHSLQVDAVKGNIYQNYGYIEEKEIKKILNYNVNVDKRLECNETFTEVLACFWFIYLHKYRYKKSPTFAEIWKKEYKMYISVCQNIITHYFDDTKNSEKLFLLKERNDLEAIFEFVSALQMKEDSHLFSYYFGKTALWSCLKYVPISLNLNYIPILQHSCEQNDCLTYYFINLYKKRCLSLEFWKCIFSPQFIKMLEKNKNNAQKFDKNSLKNLKSLKMTSIS